MADISIESATREAEILTNAGYEVTPTMVDISSRESILKLIYLATSLGSIKYFVNAAGVSPSQAPIEAILKVDLYGTAVLIKEFGKVIAQGGSGIIISSQSGYRLGAIPNEESELLATTPTEKLLSLPLLQRIDSTLKAYQYSKRCNGLRVMYEAAFWAKRGARINAISPGIIMTPLAKDEFNGQRGAMYKNMVANSPCHRVGTPDDVANVAELLLSSKGTYISGSDFLCDGGVTASWFYGDLKPKE